MFNKTEATRFLNRATFGCTIEEREWFNTIGQENWLNEQFAMPPIPVPRQWPDGVIQKWYYNMQVAKDQLRQRMIVALGQIFVISAYKNDGENDFWPWLEALSLHAFGNFKDLLREMTLNRAMGKYLDLAESIAPSYDDAGNLVDAAALPNENYAREVMQLFTIGTVMLKPNGNIQLDSQNNPIPAYTQETVRTIAYGLSGWTYAPIPTLPNKALTTWRMRPRATTGKRRLTDLVSGDLVLSKNNSAEMDLEAIIDWLFQHPNLPPFIATRLIRSFVTSNPGPDYIEYVSKAFIDGAGDLRATLRAVLTAPAALMQADQPDFGHLKDALHHKISLLRKLNAEFVSAAYEHYDNDQIGQALGYAPSVFGYYSPLDTLPGQPALFGPEFQLYNPTLAITRANMIKELLVDRSLRGQRISFGRFTFDAPNTNAPPDLNLLLDRIADALFDGEIPDAMRAGIIRIIQNAPLTDPKAQAISAIYLLAISPLFAVNF